MLGFVVLAICNFHEQNSIGKKNKTKHPQRNAARFGKCVYRSNNNRLSEVEILVIDLLWSHSSLSSVFSHGDNIRSSTKWRIILPQTPQFWKWTNSSAHFSSIYVLLVGETRENCKVQCYRFISLSSPSQGMVLASSLPPCVMFPPQAHILLREYKKATCLTLWDYRRFERWRH